MIKILLVSPFSKDANSYYRALGPWNYLAKQNRKRRYRHTQDLDAANVPEVEIRVAQDSIGVQGIAWDVVDQFDLVFMHRPCRNEDITIMKVAYNLGVPVWVDYDDWLFDVPYWNPVRGQYMNPAVHQAIAMCIGCADVVSVSTAALYDKLKLVNPNVVILPNMYREDLYKYRASQPPERKNAFAWRGTATHDMDLLSVKDGWKMLPDKVTFFGGPYWGLLSEMRQGSYDVVGAQDPFLYMKAIYDFAPKVMLVSLVDNLFNRVKSNIAYQEALHAGAVCVAPDMLEWQRPGVITYEPGNSMSFLHAATQAYEMSEEARAEAVHHAFTHMQELYGAPHINRIRENVLEAVATGKYEKNPRSPWDEFVGLWVQGRLKGSPVQNVSEEALKAKGLAV